MVVERVGCRWVDRVDWEDRWQVQSYIASHDPFDEYRGGLVFPEPSRLQMFAQQEEGAPTPCPW